MEDAFEWSFAAGLRGHRSRRCSIIQQLRERESRAAERRRPSVRCRLPEAKTEVEACMKMLQRAGTT